MIYKNVSKKIAKLLIFTLSFSFMICAASAASSGYYSDDYYRFSNGDISHVSELENNSYIGSPWDSSNAVLDTDGNYFQVNPDDSVTFKNMRLFTGYAGGTISLENATIYIDNPDSSQDMGFLSGTWKVSNSNISSITNYVDFISNFDYYDLHDVSFKKLKRYSINMFNNKPYYGDIYNISISDSKSGLIVYNKLDGSISQIQINNMTQQSFESYNGTGVEISNVRIVDGGDYLNPSTDGVAFLLKGGRNNYAHDIYINGSGWSSFDLTQDEHDTVVENVYVENSGHNGVDFHGQWNISITNVTVVGSDAENFLITGREDLYTGKYSDIDYSVGNGPSVTHSIYIKDYSSYDSPGAALVAHRTINLTVDNLNSPVGGGGIQAYNSLGVTIINSTVDHSPAFSFGAGGTYGSLKDLYVIDSKFSSYGILYVTENAHFINTQVPNIYFSTGLEAEYNMDYYADVKLLDSNNNIVSNAEAKFSGADSRLSSLNGNGHTTQLFYTEEDGHTSLPNVNRENSPVLSEYYKNYPFDEHLTGSYEVALNANDGKSSVTLTDITPDSTWYRENPNIPTYTITAIIPDESSTEPQITGFAPSSDNPFTAGESKKFQVWADEELTTMKWYVNGNLVSSGSMDYTWKVESGSTTIMFSGFNSNGAVVQTWEITEGEIVEEAPVSSGTGLSFTPSASSLTATTGESTTFSVETTQEFTSAVWSVDGTEVETGTTGHVEAWTTAGTHTVTFDGTAAAGTISRSWTVVVSAAAESEYSSISISPSTTTVAPGESFSLDVYIDPTQALTGSQFDLQYSQLASISTVDEGDLFTASGLATTFQYDSISNAEGLLDNVYAAIVGSGTITSSGVMATIEMVAGSSSGVLDLGLSDVILSDANSNPAGYTVSNATVLIDTAPQFTSVSAQTVEEKQSLSFTVTANDADGDDLSYSSTSLPSGATFNDGSFSWTPSQGDAGSYVATFEVTDGYLTDTVSVSITVTPLNNLPEITLFEPADGSTFEEGSIIGVNVAATDADGDSLSYIIEIDSVKVSTATSYTWTTDYESAGTHTIKVTVSDGTDEVSSSGTITITDVQPRWDVNEDGTVNVLDITLVGQNYGQTYTENLPRWDVNQDGTVNIQDLSIVSGHFGETI
ncbi:dockerin type I domain-containing protein [Methanolobus sp. WCC1]|uniref:Ig-like domain-containing protein n=2 Tax=unclassified Methanolobus TaxID=2629569 RepID=UPI00324994E7